MKRWVEQICSQYGQWVTIEPAVPEQERERVRAFLQPMTAKDEAVPSSQTEIGWRDTRRWLYLGTTVLKPDDEVCWNGMRFAVRSSRPYWLGASLLYNWATLECVEEVET